MLSGESAPLMSGGAKPNRPGFFGLLNGVYVSNTISRWSPPGPVTSAAVVGALCGEGSPPGVLRILTRSRSSSAAPRRYGRGFLSFGRTGFAVLVFPTLNLGISSPSKSKLHWIHLASRSVDAAVGAPRQKNTPPDVTPSPFEC